MKTHHRILALILGLICSGTVVAGDGFPNLGPAGCEGLCQQRLACQHHAGDAIAALDCAVIDEVLLQVVRASISAADAFDGDHLAAAGLRGQDQAGVHQLAIEQHAACAALAHAAAFLGPGQANIVSQEMQQLYEDLRAGGDNFYHWMTSMHPVGAAAGDASLSQYKV